MTLVLAAAAVLLAAYLVARFARADAAASVISGVERWLASFGAPVAAVLSVAAIWYVWGEVQPTPVVHDEVSYVLQAEIFASGRWTAPRPPIPEFFAPPHVLVDPVVASKYPPGNALLLTPGALVGFPALTPLFLTAAAAFLLFLLVKRVTNVWVATLAWVIWISTPLVLRFQPSYLSEVATLALMLASWWALLEWRDTRKRSWLLWLAVAVGWGAITRPLTMLALAIPIGIVVVRDVARGRLWKDFGLAVGVGVAVLMILPLWSARTTGDWRVSPLSVYRRDYMPYDKLGFTADTTPPRRDVSPVVYALNRYFLQARKDQPVTEIPRIIRERLETNTVAYYQGGHLPLLLFGAAGLFLLTPALQFAVLSALLLFLVHIPYAHDATWTLYYLETTPVVAAVTAWSVWRMLQRAGKGPHAAPAKMGATIAIVGMMLIAWPAIERWRRDHLEGSALHRWFATYLATLPKPSVVFVQYSRPYVAPPPLVFVPIDASDTPVWVVHDFGPRNDELRRLAPDRTPISFVGDQLARYRR